MKHKSKRDYSKTALHIVQKYFPKVKNVADADEALEVEVTTKDVKDGAKKDHAGCAMAVACKREHHADGVIMARSVAYVVRGENATRYHLPPSVAHELVAFDRGANFEPGQYSLSRPTNAKRLGNDSRRGRQERVKSAINSKNGGHRYPEHKARHVTENIRTVLGAK